MIKNNKIIIVITNDILFLYVYRVQKIVDFYVLA